MNPIKNYPKQGSFKIVNLQQQIARNDFAPFVLPTSEDEFPRSRLFVRRAGTLILFRLTFAIFKNESRLRMNVYMRLVNRDSKKSRFCVIEKEVVKDEFIYTLGMEVREIMNLKNGWLIDGSLVFECGAYIKAILGEDGIWKFNFGDPVYDNENNNDRMFFANKEKMGAFSYKQLPTFHSPYIDSVTVDYTVTLENDIHRLVFENCLQLVHGVRMKLEESKLKSIISIARSLKLYNVVHYCQYQLMISDGSVKNLKFAFEFNTHHYLAHLLGLVESREELKEVLKGMDIQKMSGESMKQCAKFFFDVEI